MRKSHARAVHPLRISACVGIIREDDPGLLMAYLFARAMGKDFNGIITSVDPLEWCRPTKEEDFTKPVILCTGFVDFSLELLKTISFVESKGIKVAAIVAFADGRENEQNKQLQISVPAKYRAVAQKLSGLSVYALKVIKSKV